MLGIACSTEEKVKVTAAPLTATGKPARFDGALKVTVQSGDGTVTQDPGEPNSFFAVSGDAPGTTVYLIEADADLGTGIITLQDTVELEVAGVNAASFGLTAGAPEAK
jgi:hypothetical protein